MLITCLYDKSLIKNKVMIRNKLIQFRVNEEEYNSIKANADELTIPTGTFSRISTLNAVKSIVDYEEVQ